MSDAGWVEGSGSGSGLNPCFVESVLYAGGCCVGCEAGVPGLARCIKGFVE